MLDSDSREGASRGQSQSTHPPAVIPGGLYTRKQLMANLGVGQATWEAWVEGGLVGVTNTGAANHFYFGDDVLHFIASFKAKG